MKITRLETLFVRPRWVFLKMHTDAGLVGWGEPAVEGWARTVAQCTRDMGRYLVGRDPRQIERHWQVLHRGGFYRGGPVLTGAISGIEQAMWDILGKSLDVPVYQLFGGAVRDRIRLYGHTGGEDLDSYVASGRRARDEGFTVLKTGIPEPARHLENPAYIARAVERIAALREGVGPEVDIAIDLHGRVRPALAIALARALEPYGIYFLEEPCPPENIDEVARVAHATCIPIAIGERLYTRWGFREVLEKQAAAVLQPDLSHAGGIAEVRKIAAMAEPHEVALAPHCPLGPISLAAALQVDACSPNFLVQEQVTLGEGLLVQPFEVTDGYVPVPTEPGLGIEIDEAALAERLDDGGWETPRWQHEDGAAAEW